MRSHRWRPVGALSLVVLFAIGCDNKAPADGEKDARTLVRAADVAHKPPPGNEDTEAPGDVPDLTGNTISGDYNDNKGKLIPVRAAALRKAVAANGVVHFRKAVAWFAFCEYGEVAKCKDATGAIDVSKVVRIGVQAVHGSRKMDPKEMHRKGGRVFARVRVLNALAIPDTPDCNTGLAGLAREIGSKGEPAYWFIGPHAADPNGMVGFVLADSRGAFDMDIRPVAQWYWEHTPDGLHHKAATHGDVKDNEAGVQFRFGAEGSQIVQPVIFDGAGFMSDPDWDTKGLGGATLRNSVEPGCAAGPYSAPAATPEGAAGSVVASQNPSVASNGQRPGSGLWISCMSGCCASGSNFGRFASAAPPAADDRKQQKKKGT